MLGLQAIKLLITLLKLAYDLATLAFAVLYPVLKLIVKIVFKIVFFPLALVKIIYRKINADKIAIKEQYIEDKRKILGYEPLEKPKYIVKSWFFGNSYYITKEEYLKFFLPPNPEKTQCVDMDNIDFYILEEKLYKRYCQRKTKAENKKMKLKIKELGTEKVEQMIEQLRQEREQRVYYLEKHKQKISGKSITERVHETEKKPLNNKQVGVLTKPQISANH